MKNFTQTSAHIETAITKMEKAIFISKIENLKYVTNSYSRLYFGNEFCERLLHSKKDLDKIISFVKEKNLKFSYVTPYVTNSGLKILDDNISHILKKLENPEVVINDWGVMKLAKSYKIQPVLGRLLTKMKKGPRIMNYIHNYPKEMVEHFQKANVGLPIFQEYLIKQGIKRVELDNALQGINMNFSDSNINASLYHPFVYLTTTRRCLVNSCDVISKRDIIGIYPCNKECQKYTIELSHEVMPKPILLKGNSQFLKNDNIPDDLEKKGINRMVYQPEIPI